MSLASPADIIPFTRFSRVPPAAATNGGHDRHAGHTVGVIAITSDTEMNHRDSFTSAIGSSTRERAR
jgi:hypothetical protein